jgi:hypothetical protein
MNTLNTLLLRLLVPTLIVAVVLVGLQPATPTRAAQPADAAVERVVRDAHAEAIELLRTGRTDILRSYTRNAVDQIAEQMEQFRALGVTLRAASEPVFQGIRVEGNRAAALTLTNIEVTYFGFFTDLLKAEITWYLLFDGSRWLVDALEIEL